MGRTVDRGPVIRLAFLCSATRKAKLISRPGRARCILDINDEAKQIVQDLGAAINEAVENSPQVARAIEHLREAGYEMELTLRLEIGLRPHEELSTDDAQEDSAFDLTDEDKRTLRRMKIRIDETE